MTVDEPGDRPDAGIGEPPPVQDLVRMLETAGGVPDGGSTRAELLVQFPELGAVPVTELTIPGEHGTVPARLYRRTGAASAGFVWVHGGAFVGGNLDMAEAHWVGLALAVRGIAVLSLDYRKALHGVRFPAASNDVLYGWRWAVEHADELGVDVARLHLGGASAGANLVAGVAKRLRDAAGRAPASVVLVYPLVHPELPAWDPADLATIRNSPGAVFFAPEWLADINLNYVGDPAALADPYAFAANGDVTGLPPTFILNCELDTLRSSGEAYAEQLKAAGVEVTVRCEPGAVHGCLSEPTTPQGARSLDRIADWLTSER